MVHLARPGTVGRGEASRRAEGGLEAARPLVLDTPENVRRLIADTIQDVRQSTSASWSREEAAARRRDAFLAEYDALSPKVADLRAEHRTLKDAVDRYEARIRDALQAHEARKAGAAA
jgi:hypothetical protein